MTSNTCKRIAFKNVEKWVFVFLQYIYSPFFAKKNEGAIGKFLIVHKLFFAILHSPTLLPQHPLITQSFIGYSDCWPQNHYIDTLIEFCLTNYLLQCSIYTETLEGAKFLKLLNSFFAIVSPLSYFLSLLNFIYYAWY